jgi:predicted secreted Zn-dependent protease
MNRILLAASLVGLTALPSMAANLSKTYSYFTVGGTTLDQLDAQLSARGPKVKSTGQRHPGATQMQFTTKLGYSESKGYCRISEATVSVKVKVILPKWRQRGKADQDVRLIWDTLSSDIKRHEEAHVTIAKNHARELEQKLRALGRQKSCAAAAEKASAVAAKVLARHDEAQAEFDRAESANFEQRMLRLLRYRMQMIQAGKLPG